MKLQDDIKNPTLLYAKGFLFLITGALAAGLLLLERPTWRVALLLGLSIWCFARFYYFAFYVIEHYVDSEYRFAGLIDFFRYMLRSKKNAGTRGARKVERADKIANRETR